MCIIINDSDAAEFSFVFESSGSTAESLQTADVVVLADVYAARETDTLGIHCEDLADDIRRKGTESYYFQSFDAIENFLLETCTDNDLILTMGAGDIYQVGERLLGRR